MMVRLFRHYFPVSYLVLALVETSFLFGSVYLGAVIRFGGYEQAATTLQSLWAGAGVFTIVMAGSMAIMGFYYRHARYEFRELVLRLAISFAVSFLLLSFAFYVFPAVLIGRGVMVIAALFAFAGILAARAVYQRIAEEKALKRRVVVLGAGHKAATINKYLRRKTDRRGFKILYYIPLPGEQEVVTQDVRHVGTSLKDILRQDHVEEIVVAADDRRRGFPLHEIVDCRMSGIEVTDLLSFIERYSGKVLLSQMDPSWLMYSDGFRSSSIKMYAKRLADIVVSTVALMVFSPLLLLTVIAIFLEDRSGFGVIYRQQRVGQNNRVFTMYKFRSMRNSAEEDGVARWADKGDERATRVGRIIRMYRIDELPQLINVIRGDMSLVGPRPERPEFVRELSERIPYYIERHRVKPGITGWAQICYPYGASEEDAAAKLEYDLYYVKNHSLFLDMLIAIQTIQAVLWGGGGR